MDKTRQVRGCVRVRVCVRACVRVSARGRGACEGMTIETPRIHASSLHLVQVCVSLEDSCDTSYRMTVHDEVAVGGLGRHAGRRSRSRPGHPNPVQHLSWSSK